MEKNDALSDEKLTEIAWKAIRDSFPEEATDGASLKFIRSVYAGSPSDPNDHGGDFIEVWLMHPNTSYHPDPVATGKADSAMIYAINEQNGGAMILMLLYHGFPDRVSKHRKAA